MRVPASRWSARCLVFLLAAPLATAQGPFDAGHRGEAPRVHQASMPASEESRQPPATSPPASCDAPPESSGFAWRLRFGPRVAYDAGPAAGATGEEGTAIPEPVKETRAPGKRKFFRTVGGAIVIAIAGALVIGAAARSSLDD